MTELNDLGLLDKLERDIERILSVNDSLREQNSKLQTQNDALVQENKAIVLSAQKLQKQTDRLLIQRSITDTAADVDSAKARLDKLIKEVDRCIALMNK